MTRWLCVALWMLVIYWFSDQPTSNQVTEEIFGDSNYFVRKSAHITEFAILFLLSLWAMRKDFGAALDRKVVFAALLTVAYAASDEFHQSFVPNRSACVQDVLVDSVGVLAAVAMLFLWRLLVKNRKSL